MIRFVCLPIIAFALSSALAEPVTDDRVSGLPAGKQPAWRTYLEQSKSNVLADAAAVQQKVAARNLTNTLRAPSGGDFKLSHKTGDAWYTGDEAKEVADTILSYQTPTGGWSKHLGFTRGPRQPGMQWTSQNEPGQPAHYVATFDNNSTTEEMQFLANVWLATQREDCQAGFSQGLNFIFAAQYPNGGWPQVYPLEGGYHDDVTYNDDAMTHTLELLHAITMNEPAYAFLDDSQKKQAADALAKGLDCVLKTQITQSGRKTVWCAQNDPLTLQPANARKMEPATLSGLESAHILKFLMTITNPTPEVVTCVENGLKWLEDARITGVAKTSVNGKTVYETNAVSTEIYWARFYNLTNSQPVFPGRDGVLYETFVAMIATNRGGYDYYTTQPGSIIKNGQKKWRKMLASQTGK